MRVPAVFFVVSVLFGGTLQPGDAAPAAPPGAATAGERTREELEEELEEFEPSEELPADSAISFPVDI